MKKVQTSIFLAAMAWGAIAATFGATGRPGPGVTSGDLSRDLAAIARMAGATEISRRLLTIDPGMKADTPLTEGRAVAILQKAGFPAATSSPDRVLTRDRAAVLVMQFRSSLASLSSRAGSAAEKSGPSDTVDSCFDEKTHGACMDCCKELGGETSTCAKACMVINKSSASEPLP
jgi:hypothetical protein